MKCKFIINFNQRTKLNKLKLLYRKKIKSLRTEMKLKFIIKFNQTTKLNKLKLFYLNPIQKFKGGSK